MFNFADRLLGPGPGLAKPLKIKLLVVQEHMYGMHILGHGPSHLSEILSLICLCSQAIALTIWPWTLALLIGLQCTYIYIRVTCGGSIYPYK